MNNVLPARKLSHALAAALAPQAMERVMRLRGDLRLGVPVVLTDRDQAALVMAVELLRPDRWAALCDAGQPLQLVLTGHRAAALGLAGPEAAVVQITLPRHVTRAAVSALADPAQPRPASADLLALPGDTIHRAAVALAKSAQLLPAAIVVPLSEGLDQVHLLDLCHADAGEALAELAAPRAQAPVAAAHLPMAAHATGRVHVFRPDDGGIEHYAIEIGTPDFSQPVLVRLHSACFTGDVMGSLKCDCGAQLAAATAAMAAAGGGVLLYLNQEGRGIGMANKMRAYALQDQGCDTVEANHHLGFNDDERDFRIGAALLAQLRIGAVRLLTNNPAKVAILRAQGITVIDRMPLQVGQTPQNARYLATKAAKSGHLLT